MKSLEFQVFPKWEAWIDIGGTREEEEEEEDNGFVAIKIIPDFLRTTLKKLEVLRIPILEQHCKRGTREDGHKISHILSVKIDSD